MARITFIGAGSVVFTRNLVRDILTFPLLRDNTLVLMDINAERLAFAAQSVQQIIDRGQYPAQIVTTIDRVEALKGSDVVLCTILASPFEVWQHDIEIPNRYGVDTNIGDTRGPSGIFRALRTIPVMLGIVKDMEQYCPDAVLQNYSNPMAMLCRAMQRSSPIALTGDPRLVFQAIAYDPLTAAVLSLAEIRTMVNEMLNQNREHLPQFKRFSA